MPGGQFLKRNAQTRREFRRSFVFKGCAGVALPLQLRLLRCKEDLYSEQVRVDDGYHLQCPTGILFKAAPS